MRIKTFWLLSFLYILSVTDVFSQALFTEPVRGVWVTNVASDALRSREQIQKAVLRCKEFGLNHLFVVVGYNLVNN